MLFRTKSKRYGLIPFNLYNDIQTLFWNTCLFVIKVSIDLGMVKDSSPTFIFERDHQE